MCLFARGRGYHFTLSKRFLQQGKARVTRRQANPSTRHRCLLTIWGFDSHGSKTLGIFCVRDHCFGHEIVIQCLLPGSLTALPSKSDGWKTILSFWDGNFWEAISNFRGVVLVLMVKVFEAHRHSYQPSERRCIHTSGCVGKAHVFSACQAI